MFVKDVFRDMLLVYLVLLYIVIPAAGTVFIVRGIVIAIRKVTAGIPVYSYECSTCGYKWSWTAGMPQPTVSQYAPNQLLFDEQKKRDAAAAAWAYEMQRRQREDNH